MEEIFTAELLSLTSRPLVGDHRKWLRSFVEAFPQWVDGDTLGSTYAIMGAVILAGVAADCQDVDFLQGLFRLPKRFIALVIGVMDAKDLSASAQILDIECALRDNADDFAGVEELLHAVKEELWDTCWSQESGDAAGALSVGLPDRWRPRALG